MFDNKLNALLYAFVPVDVDVLQSNPNVFPEVILPPEYLGKFGRAPSKPPWNGTMNFLVVLATFDVK